MLIFAKVTYMLVTCIGCTAASEDVDWNHCCDGSVIYYLSIVFVGVIIKPYSNSFHVLLFMGE